MVRLNNKIASLALTAIVGVGLSGCGNFLKRDFVLPGERTNILPQQENITSETALNKTAQLPGGKKNIFGSDIRTLWSTKVGVTNNRHNSQTALPQFSNGRIYTLDNNSQVMALSSKGQPIWKTKVNRKGEHSQHIGGGLIKTSHGIYVGTGSAQLVKLDNNGRRLWSAEADAPVRAAPVASRSTVYAQTAQDELIAFDTKDGREKWRYKAAGESDGYRGNSQPVLQGGKIIILTNAGNLVALKASDGSIVWEKSLFNRRTNFIGGNPNAPRSQLKLLKAGLFVSTAEGQISLVNPSTGSIRWKRNFGTASNIIISGGSVYLIDENDILRSISSSNGSDKWSISLRTYQNREKQYGRIKWFGPAITGNNLYVLSSRGNVVVFSTQGKPLRGRKLKASFSSAPIARGNAIYTFGNGGKLLSIR